MSIEHTTSQLRVLQSTTKPHHPIQSIIHFCWRERNEDDLLSHWPKEAKTRMTARAQSCWDCETWLQTKTRRRLVANKSGQRSGYIHQRHSTTISFSSLPARHSLISRVKFARHPSIVCSQRCYSSQPCFHQRPDCVADLTRWSGAYFSMHIITIQ